MKIVITVLYARLLIAFSRKLKNTGRITAIIIMETTFNTLEINDISVLSLLISDPAAPSRHVNNAMSIICGSITLMPTDNNLMYENPSIHNTIH